MATAGMVCGILGIVLCWVPLLGLLLALLGIVFGSIGMARAGRLGRGKGAGVAGLVTGILGLLVLPIMAAIAIPAFLEYQKTGKSSASELQLRSLERKIKSYYNERAQLPPSTQTVMPGPPGSGCMSGSHDMKIPARPFGDWIADPGWAELHFQIDEPSLYSYSWTRDSATHGHADAMADLDCDTTISTRRLDIDIVEGNVQATLGVASPD